MKVALIRTPVINLKNSPFGSTPGIPSNLAYLASVLQKHGHTVAVVDSYGLAPHRFTDHLDKFEARGLLPDEIVGCIPPDVEVIGISIHCTLEHGMGISILKMSKEHFPDVPVVIGGYHTTFCVEPFLEAGADYVLQGEGEQRFPMLLEMMENSSPFTLDGIHGGGFSSERVPVNNPIEDLPFGNFDPLPLETYWKLHYAHGPVRTGKYISLFTSRGCPFACAFCQTPKMWGGHWMAKSSSRIVDEMDYYNTKYGVTDFHIQDENFSLSRERTRRFAKELLKRNRNYTYCFPSGIKVETVDEEELELLYRSGCRYFALSPESASKKVLKLMNKPVDLEHVEKVVSLCHGIGIRVNCNFVLGFPGEEKMDRKKTYRFIRKLARLGLDEIVTFMLTPLPETDVDNLMPEGLEYEDINFSPTWRDNYKTITRARIWIYAQFAILKLLFHPLKVLDNIRSVLTRRFKMKADMTVYRFMVDIYDRHLRGLSDENTDPAIIEAEWFPPDGDGQIEDRTEIL
jgi:anaerobic magnesium-protoporphyrin IX monomethyl ester cyclase